MLGMICINSTSILESILFNKPAFVYGKDLFLNKDLVHFNIRKLGDFIEASKKKISSINCDKFISLLLQRQVDRKKCVSNDIDYIRDHY